MAEETRTDFLTNRLALRKSLTRKSFYTYDENEIEDYIYNPSKKRKVETPVQTSQTHHNYTEEETIGPLPLGTTEDSGLEFSVGSRYKKELDPKFLEHMGYMNRNARPPSSKRKEILVSLDTKKKAPTVNLEERRLKEQAKVEQMKSLLNKFTK